MTHKWNPRISNAKTRTPQRIAPEPPPSRRMGNMAGMVVFIAAALGWLILFISLAVVLARMV